MSANVRPGVLCSFGNSAIRNSASPSLSLQRDSVRVQRRGHDAGDDGGIALHEGAGGGGEIAAIAVTSQR
jgi:hypothetical protein